MTHGARASLGDQRSPQKGWGGHCSAEQLVGDIVVQASSWEADFCYCQPLMILTERRAGQEGPMSGLFLFSFPLF